MKKVEKKGFEELGYRVYGPEEKLLFESRSSIELMDFVLTNREQVKPLKVVKAYGEVVEEEVDVFWGARS